MYYDVDWIQVEIHRSVSFLVQFDGEGNRHGDFVFLRDISQDVRESNVSNTERTHIIT